MSDSKDQKPGKPDPFAGLPDMESTVRIDFGDNQNVFSTSARDKPAPGAPSPDDFDKTIDGLLDMEELLNSDKTPADAQEATLSFSTDDLNFNDLDADVSSLSDSLSKQSIDADDFNKDDDFTATQEFSNFPPLLSNGSDRLDNLDDEFDADDLLEIDGTVRLDTTEDDNDDAVFSATLNEPMNDLIKMGASEEISEESAEASPMLDIYGSGNDATPELTADPADELNQADASYIHLTKEMSVKAKQPPLLNALDKLDHPFDHGVDTPADKYSETIAATPELTTTETNVLASATSAIREINDEERQASDMRATPLSDHPSSAVPRSGGSNMLPMLIGLAGVIAGGFGAWMAFDANSHVQDLKNQIQSMNPAHQIEQEQDMIDIQQRLVYIENRLTAAAASEQAAVAEAAVSDIEAAQIPEAVPATSQAPATKVAAITPQTELAQARAQATPQTGTWIVNVSSHTQEQLAIKEQQRLKSIGLNAEMHPTRINNTTWYRVQITGFETKDEAKAKIREIEERSGIKGIWIGKR